MGLLDGLQCTKKDDKGIVGGVQAGEHGPMTPPADDARSRSTRWPLGGAGCTYGRKMRIWSNSWATQFSGQIGVWVGYTGGSSTSSGLYHQVRAQGGPGGA